MITTTADNFANENLEYPACPLCASSQQTIRYRLATPFRVARCLSCGIHYLTPRLTESRMATCYGDDYFSSDQFGYQDYRQQESALRMTFRRLIGKMREHGLTGGSLLEIGTGYGYFLDEARGHFPYRVGTELSVDAATQAAKSADLIVLGGPAELDDGLRFDCIVMSQVVEHLYNPTGFLAAVRQRLAPGGRVLIVTPDFGSIWRRAMGAKWPSFKVPEHVIFFDRASLGRLLVAAGFPNIVAIDYPHAFPFGLIAAKLHLSLPQRLAMIDLWLPGTCLAVIASANDR